MKESKTSVAKPDRLRSFEDSRSGASLVDQWTFDQVPLCLPSERHFLADGLKNVSAGKESLLIIEFKNFFSSGLDLEYIVSFMLCVNALTMWKTAGAVTRLLVLSGDVSMQKAGNLYAFSNQFRSLIQGGLARIDNAASWIDHLGIRGDMEPLDFRDFRRAVRVFSAARMSPDNLPSLASIEWYFGFHMNGPHGRSIGHFDYDSLGSHSSKISNADGSLDVKFEDVFTSGPCEILSSSKQSAYKMSFDLSGVRAPLKGVDAARYLSVFSSLVVAHHGLFD
jgi:hypothetical protein